MHGGVSYGNLHVCLDYWILPPLCSETSPTISDANIFSWRVSKVYYRSGHSTSSQLESRQYFVEGVLFRTVFQANGVGHSTHKGHLLDLSSSRSKGNLSSNTSCFTANATSMPISSKQEQKLTVNLSSRKGCAFSNTRHTFHFHLFLYKRPSPRMHSRLTRVLQTSEVSRIECRGGKSVSKERATG